MQRHQHLIVRAEIRRPPVKADVAYMNEWFKDLIESINMKILLGPYTTYCDVVGNRGFTGIVAIETSSSTLHVWDEDSPAMFQFDLYTCSELDIQTVFDKMKVFEPVNIAYKFLDRENDLVLVKEGKWSIPQLESVSSYTR